MGGTTTTNQTTQTSGPTNPDVNATTSVLAQKLGGLANQTAPYFNQSEYAPVGSTTQNAWTQGSNQANSLIGSGGLTSGQHGAMSGQSGLLGAYDQNAPGYQAMRTQALNDAVQGVTAGQLGSGLLGSRSYIQDATKAGVNALAPLDYANYQNSVENQKGIYSTLFGEGQQGLGNQQAAVSSLGAIGAAQDQNQQSILSGQADLYDRQTQAPLQWLQGITSASNGNAASSPQAQSSSTQMPWWMAGLGAAATGAGIYGALKP